VPVWKNIIMPEPFPKEFRDDVVRVAQSRNRGVTIAEVARDFGAHICTFDNWMHQAGIEVDEQSDVTAFESTEVRDLRRESRLLEQKNEVLRRTPAYLSQVSLSEKGSTRS
jgi:transposase-like protein